MLESFILARDRFLKPDGVIFPSNGSIIFAPITDENIYKEQYKKAEFWNNNNFYGIDMTSVVSQAHEEYFSQPIVGYIPNEAFLTKQRAIHTIDFNTVTLEELKVNPNLHMHSDEILDLL